jgi:hypothetical protein
MGPKGCLLRCILEGQTLLILQGWRYQVSFGEGVQFFENMVCCNCAFAQVFGVVLFLPGCRVLPAVAEPKAALLTVNSHFLDCTNLGGHEMATRLFSTFILIRLAGNMMSKQAAG